MRSHDRKAAVAITGKAMASGRYTQQAGSALWRISGKCERPVRREMKFADRPKPWTKEIKVRNSTYHLDLDTRCRQCGPCLKARAYLWSSRAVSEFKRSERTWFGTLTLSPQAHFDIANGLRTASAKHGDDWDRRPSEVQFRDRCNEIGKSVTLYLKRIRKESSALIKYILVFEEHKTGLPHMHMLVHETGGTVRYKTLTDQWRLGFTMWKLVHDEYAARYVTKYLSKSAIARVRASVRYGANNEVESQQIP